MHGALEKEEISGIEHQEGQNHHAWSTKKVRTIIHGAKGTEELSGMEH